MNDEKYEQLLKAVIETGYMPSQTLDKAVREKIMGAGKDRVNWLAITLICASLIMLFLESLFSWAIIGGTAACVFFITQVSFLNLTISCCILKQKTKWGEFL